MRPRLGILALLIVAAAGAAVAFTVLEPPWSRAAIGDLPDRLAGRLPVGGGAVVLRRSFADCPESSVRALRDAAATRLSARLAESGEHGLDDDAVLALGRDDSARSQGDGILVAGACSADTLRLIAVDLASGQVTARVDGALFPRARRGTGQMLVTSRPSDVAVLLDGIEVGRTPALVSAAIGTHTIALRDSRFHPVEDTITLAAGVNRQAHYRMQAGEGRIAVVTRPSRAEIWLDGRRQRELTPALLGPLPAGIHRLELRNGDGNSIEAPVTVPTAETAWIQMSFAGGKTAREGVVVDAASGIELVAVAAGCFRMGCGPWTNECDPDETIVHDVCLDGFMIGRTEVTAAQWKAVMGALPAGHSVPDDRPVGQVTWEDAQAFLRRLNTLSGDGFRLPTEAEWEYACRGGGRPEKFPGGTEAAERKTGTDYVQQFGWVGAARRDGPFPVARKLPNGIGLFDMAGNTWEWTADSFAPYAYHLHAGKNPVFTEETPLKVIRGGSWVNYARLARCSHRDRRAESYHSADVGLRVVRSR